MLKLIRILLEGAFWIFAAATALFAVGLAAGFLIAPVFGYITPLALVVLLPIAVQSVQAVRRRRGMTALSYIEQAVRLNLPLPRMVEAARRGERGALRRRLADLRELLEAGYPLGEAIAEAVPEVPRRDVALCLAGERLGRLPQTMARINDEHRRYASSHDFSATAFNRAYPLLMFLFVIGILALVAVFVIPKYESIFRDFGQKLPAVTVITMNLAREFGPPLLLLMVVLTLLYVGRALWEAVRPSRMDFGVDLGIVDRLLWYLPGVHTAVRDRSLADALFVVSDAMEIGTAVDRALHEAAQLRINRVLRERMTEWADEVAGGMPIHEAARRAGLPRLVVGMLATARGPSGAADVMRFLARYYRGRFSRSVALLEGALVPAVVLLFGALVATVALAMFLPMTRLADSLSLQTGFM